MIIKEKYKERGGWLYLTFSWLFLFLGLIALYKGEAGWMAVYGLLNCICILLWKLERISNGLKAAFSKEEP